MTSPGLHDGFDPGFADGSDHVYSIDIHEFICGYTGVGEESAEVVDQPDFFSLLDSESFCSYPGFCSQDIGYFLRLLHID